jgi:hypothetical protein
MCCSFLPRSKSRPGKAKAMRMRMPSALRVTGLEHVRHPMSCGHQLLSFCNLYAATRSAVSANVGKPSWSTGSCTTECSDTPAHSHVVAVAGPAAPLGLGLLGQDRMMVMAKPRERNTSTIRLSVRSKTVTTTTRTKHLYFASYSCSMATPQRERE